MRTGWLRRGAVWVALLALCGGCRVGLDVAVDVERDGSGTVAVTLAADAEAQGRAADAGADPLDLLADAGAALAEQGWTAEDTAPPEGGRRLVLRTAFADPAELDALMADLTTALDAPEVRLLEPLAVELTDDRVRLRGGAGLVPTAAIADTGYAPEQVVALLRERDALTYTVTATFPGAVLDTTAGSVTDRTAVWEVRPGERVDVRAEAERPGISYLPAVAAGLLGTVAVGVLGVLVRRRLGPAPTGADPDPSIWD